MTKDGLQQEMSRRAFLKATTTATALGMIQPGCVSSRLTRVVESKKVLHDVSEEQWRTFESLQDHLLPSEPGAPGARDVRATEYLLRVVINDPRLDPREQTFVTEGASWLEAFGESTGYPRFVNCSFEQREKLLQQFSAEGRGKRWVSTIISYTLEALLGDPAYGVNPGGIGWKWLSHAPGSPRPEPTDVRGVT